MFKVLIVDDEPIIRKGIRNIVNWNSFGCEVCGEADNGLDGKAIIENLHPDIIVTDIKMPEVDGLTMIQDIKKIVPDSKIIIVTGYRDFEYAREAIKLGAFDYLLKPTKIEEINDVVSRAVKELRNATNILSQVEEIKKVYNKNLPMIKEKLLYKMIYGTYQDDITTMKEAESLGINIKGFMLGVIEIDENKLEAASDKDTNIIGNTEKDVKETNMYQFGIISTLEEVFNENYNVLCVVLNSKKIAFILNEDTNKPYSKEDITSKCTYLQKIVQNCFGFTISIGISSSGNGYKQLNAKLKECKEAIDHKFYIGTNCVIFYEDLGDFIKFSDYTEINNKQHKLIEDIKAGKSEDAKNSFAELTKEVNELGDSDQEYIKTFYFNTIMLINSIRTSVSPTKLSEESAVTNLYKMVERCDNLQNLNNVLGNAVKQTVDKVDNYNNNNMKLLMRRAIDYIDAHYCEEVTLNQLSQKLYVSNYYLSRMFKKELGVNFIDYLNELRIKKAKLLLANAKYKTYEVAEAVGVPNSHYFSKLFKKYVGMTASEYKESLNNIEDGSKEGQLT